MGVKEELDDRHVCKRCCRVIGRVSKDGEHAGWFHFVKTDPAHDPEPIHITEADVVFEVCDFCSEPDVTYVMHIRDTTIETSMFLIDDSLAWAACPICRDHIMDEEWEKLAERATKLHAERMSLEVGLPASILQEQILPTLRNIHQIFAKSFTGEETKLR